MRESFAYEAPPGRIVFGVGAIDRVGEETAALGGTRVLLIASHSAASAADAVAAQLGQRLARRWDEVAQHVPVDLAERARQAADESGADLVVSVGGGSAVGLAKAVALSHAMAVLAIPTTYSGSEMTAIYGLTGGSHKQTGKTESVRPRVVLYDPALTVSLPPEVTGPSAFNALAHAVEALYVPGHNPITSALALSGARLIASSLPDVMAEPADLDARSDLLLGACLAGQALGATGTGMHHKICHVLGGMFNLVHADTHAAVLPHVVAFNAAALPSDLAAGALWELARRCGVTSSLAKLGMPEEGIDDAASRAAAEITSNPVPVTVPALRGILAAAYAGNPPTRPGERQ